MTAAEKALRAAPFPTQDSVGGTSAPDLVTARFHVVGDADPGLLPRLLEPVAKLGATPMRVHASREDGDGSEISVDLRLGLVGGRMAEQVESALRRVIGVRHLMAVTEPAHPAVA